MNLKNFGAFFAKKGDEVFIIAYIKTNYMMKKPKLAKEDAFRVPNMLFIAIFDDKGRDYIADKPISIDEFKTLITKDFKVHFDFKDYSSSEDLYKAMKAKGLKKKYTPAWFAKQYEFVEKQMEQL